MSNTFKASRDIIVRTENWSEALVFKFLEPDIEAAKRQLIAAGCTVIEENPKIPRCYIRDPYGMIFNVGQSTGEK
jgi:predicted enzyme related to lactoylglutathione lyase